MEQPPQATKASDDIFDLGRPAPPPPAAAPASQDDPFAEIFAKPVPATAASAQAPAPEEPEAEDVLFPGLASRDSRRKYLSALAAEGLFSFEPEPEPEPIVAAPAMAATVVEPPAPPEPVVTAAPPAPAPPIPGIQSMSAFPELEMPLPTEQVFSAGWTPPAEPLPAVFAVEAVEEAPAWTPEAPTLVWQREEPAPAALVEEPPVFEIEERTPWAVEPAPLMPEAEVPEAAEEAAPAAEPVATVATVTLGELYLRQGHLGEARRIFEEVLVREPDSATAREGLARVAERRREKRPLEVRDLMAGYEPGHEGGETEVRSRKAYLLSSYLKRLRGGSHSDVS